MSDVFLIEHLRELTVGANRNGVARRQFDRRLGHPLTLGARGLRQQSADGLRHQVTELRSTPHRRDLGSLHQIIGQVEGGSHKYAYMLLCMPIQEGRNSLQAIEMSRRQSHSPG